MYATTVTVDHAARLRANLAAVYASRAGALRRRASLAFPHGTHAWDVVHDAFLHVLEHPPADASEASLSAALDRAVAIGCRRESNRLRDDDALRVALRKRGP